MNAIRYIGLAIVIGLAALVLAAGCRQQTIESAKRRLANLSSAQLRPLTKDDAARISESLMHIRHFQANALCSECHLASAVLSARDAVKSCRSCHEARTVDDRIWKHHCETCHPFDGALELAGGGFKAQAERCGECHPPQEGAGAYGACQAPRQPDTACAKCHDVHSGLTITTPPKSLAFSADDQKLALGNAMHKQHLNAQVQCLACHDRDTELTAADATERCSDCHAQSIVATAVWSEHCLACHAFTQTDEHALGTPRIAQQLCAECHTEAGAAETIYGFCKPGSTHNITCQRCHQPHKSAIVAGENVCASCHEDIVGKTHPSKKVHGACIMCHSPHQARKPSAELCGKCHLANQTVLVHRIPGHPEDCLACHTPHFTEVEILGDACLKCHEGMFYSSGRRQPKEHRDCENCHDIASFKYTGDGSCVKCHAGQGRILGDKRLNAQHRYCITCHKAHTWRATFESSCEACHETELVIEHKMPFHKLECKKCHDAHGTATLARSGDCQGCHAKQKLPPFKANSPDEHITCANCHPADAAATKNYSFNGTEASCLVCHTLAQKEPELAWSDVPSGHQLCNGCHAPHIFKAKPSVETCGVCHADVFLAPPIQEHADCYNCHQMGHQSLFVGEDVTCAVCHSQAAERAAGGEKAKCNTCHSPHEFKADPNSCVICHADVKEQADNAKHGDCALCHGGHNWKPGADSCVICHPDAPGLHTAKGHLECLNCHAMHTLKADSESCAVCHPVRNMQCNSPNCLDCHKFAKPPG